MSQGERKVQSAFPSSPWPRQLIDVSETGLWTVTWHFGKLLMYNARGESPLPTLTHSTSTFMNDFDFIVSESRVSSRKWARTKPSRDALVFAVSWL